MKGRAIPYSAEELAWLEANRLMVISDYARAFTEAFGRVIRPVNLAALRKRKGWTTGRTGHFVTGQTPHNKGRIYPEGVGGRHPNARRTQFAKGHRGGRAAQRYQPIGTERVSQDGYIERKIHDGRPMQSRWRLLHLLRWEEANGPVPQGHCLKCLDGDKTNTDPANWELIPRALMPRLNGGRHKTRLAYDEAAPEVRPTLLALARLDHQARERRKGGDNGR